MASLNHQQRMSAAGVDVTRGGNVYYAAPEAFTIVTDAGHHLHDPSFDPKAIKESLVQSITEQGVQTAVEVQTDGNRLLIVFGRDRVTHCKLANERLAAQGREQRKVPYVIFKGTDQDARDRITFENFHRRIPRPSDYAARIADYRKAGLPVERMATLLGIGVGMVDKYEAVGELAPKVRQAVDERLLPMAAVPTLKALSREEQVARLEEYSTAVGAGKSKQAAVSEVVKRKPKLPTFRVDIKRKGDLWLCQERVRGGKGAKTQDTDLPTALAALGDKIAERAAEKDKREKVEAAK